MPRLHSAEYYEQIDATQLQKEPKYDSVTGRNEDSFFDDEAMEEEMEERDEVE